MCEIILFGQPLLLMKILQLTNRIPYPLHDGGNICINADMEGFLNSGVSLSLLSMNTTRHYVDPAALPPVFQRLKELIVVDIDNSINAWSALKSIGAGTSYNMERFVSVAYRRQLTEVLSRDQFDIIQLEGLYLVPYIDTIRQYSKAKVVLRQHNIEYLIWERLAQKAGNFIKRKYLQHLARKLKQYELNHINDYDLVLPISVADEELYRTLGCTAPMYLHPFSIDIDMEPFYNYDGHLPVSLYHIGAMDWMPNRESVNWLLKEIMPLVNRQLPDVKLYLAGRNMPQYYFDNQWKQVEVVGEVPDAQVFEKDKNILVVPLLSGGGVRIKIFQAMASGKAIVTTNIGVEGIDAIDGVHLFIADTPEAFTEKIVQLATSPALIKEMGLAARQLIETKYNRTTVIPNLLSRYEDLLQADK